MMIQSFNNNLMIKNNNYKPIIIINMINMNYKKLQLIHNIYLD